MRFKAALIFTFFSCTPGLVFAADCSDSTLSQAREIGAEYEDLSKDLRKVVSRYDAVNFRNDALPSAFRLALPDIGDAPILPDDFFEDGRLTLDCDEDGNADAAITEVTAELEAAAKAIAAFDDQVKNSRDLVSAAEESAMDNADVAAGSAADSNDGADAGDSADDIVVEGDGTDANDGNDTDVVAREPLPNPENSDSYRRILTLPDALIFSDENTSAGDALEQPLFSVHYVFDTRTRDDIEWLEVGPTLRDDPIGWMRADDTLDWSTMLVMQFAPAGQRQRTLFFEDSATLQDIMDSVQYRREAEDFYTSIQEEREKLSDDLDYVPQWDSSLVAIEPEVGLRFDTSPYLLPILDWQDYQFDNVIDSVILQVAAVPADQGDIESRDESSFGVSQESLVDDDGIFRIGITFVIDTTVSMAPFIDRTRETVETFYDAFSKYESASFVSYGIVGFRDSMSNDPNLEYVSRVFQYLDEEAEAADVLSNMKQIQESSIPTLGFKEDAYAGVVTAIEDLDWGPFDARLLVLVTDASARSGSDPLAANEGVSEDAIINLAQRQNVAIIPIHLLTPANANNGDAQLARQQYEALGQSSGDSNYNNYAALDATDDETFGKELAQLADVIARAILQINAGEVLSIEELEPVPEGYSSGIVARAAANEIFRAQLKSLAAVDTGVTPSFLSGWAADLDLTDPDNRMMDVSVYLTRNQLSTLGQQLDRIVQAFRSGGDDPTTFFRNLQLLAAETATDPDAPPPDADDVIENILPRFLQNLPYRSEVLRISQSYWTELSVSARQELVEGLDEKLGIYQDIEDSVGSWNDFGADVGGLEVTLVPLVNLP